MRSYNPVQLIDKYVRLSSGYYSKKLVEIATGNVTFSVIKVLITRINEATLALAIRNVLYLSHKGVYSDTHKNICPVYYSNIFLKTYQRLEQNPSLILMRNILLGLVWK